MPSFIKPEQDNEAITHELKKICALIVSKNFIGADYVFERVNFDSDSDVEFATYERNNGILSTDTNVNLDICLGRVGINRIQLVILRVLKFDLLNEFNANLFDLGFVKLEELCVNEDLFAIFIKSNSDARTDPFFNYRDAVSMSSLGNNGRLGNQIFQYLFIHMYCLRNSLKPELPDCELISTYKLKSCKLDQAKRHPEIAFKDGTEDDDLALWDVPALRNVDFFGYFQNIPDRWLAHKFYIRNLIRLESKIEAVIESRIDGITQFKSKKIVACHVRRGDYVQIYSEEYPHLIPLDINYYRSWIKEIKNQIPDAVLYLASDDVATVRKDLSEFDFITSADFSAEVNLPLHIIDFEILRRADVMAMANSTFSRSAALLALNRQKCYLPSIYSKKFEAYDVWCSDPFWERFNTENKMAQGNGASKKALRIRTLRLKLENIALRNELDCLRQNFNEYFSFMEKRGRWTKIKRYVRIIFNFT